MPALNFQNRFAEAVLFGKKTQTLRKLRKRPIKAGDSLTLYTDQRTKFCFCLGYAICTRVVPIYLFDSFIRIDGDLMHPTLFDEFAAADGFIGFHSMVAFFREHYGLPFDGVLIEWDRLGRDLCRMPKKQA